MIYRKLSIKNFKGIQDVEIDLTNNRILTLVGLNESGKTTILEGINLFYKLAKDQTLTQSEILKMRPKGTSFTGDIELAAELDLEKKDHAALNRYLKERKRKINLKYPKSVTFYFNYEFNLHSFVGKSQNVTFEAKVDPEKRRLVSANNKLWNELLDFMKERLIPEILYYEDFTFEVADKITFKIDGSKANEDSQEEQWRLVLNDILRATENHDFTSFQESVVSIWKKDNDTARQRLAVMEGQLNLKITKAWRELFDADTSESRSRASFREIKILPLPENDDTLSFSFKVKTDTNREFSIDERSKGCQWFFHS